MAEENEPEFDLFGEPMLPRRERRGRPAHVFSSEYAEIIAVLSAAGRTQAEISGLVGLSEKTLRKYYSASLDHGAELAVGATLIAAFKAVKAGKVGAMNLLLRRLEGEPEQAPRQAPEPKPAPLGKKAAADLAGQTAHQSDPEWRDLLN